MYVAFSRETCSEGIVVVYSRECLGHHRKGTPRIGNVHQVFSKCLMPDNSLIVAMLQ